MSEQIQEMFSGISGTYDKVNHLLSMNRDLQWREGSVERMAAGGFSPRAALDLCAGTGDFALAVKKRFPEARVTLADFSGPMLRLAGEKTKGQQGIDLLRTDALRTPFPDMTFDAVVCGFGLRNLDSPEQGVREMARVLKPGGKAVVLDFFRPANPLLKLVYALYIGTVLPLVGGAVSGNMKAYHYLPKSAKGFVTPEELGRMMESCGFKDVDIQAHTLGIAVTVIGTRK